MTAVIICQGIAGIPCDAVGQYLKTNDFEAHGGRGETTFTPDLKDAMKFPDKNAALLYWRTPSKTVPLRPDGRPNRPLTTFHVSIEDI
jgi:hypothetical protein